MPQIRPGRKPAGWPRIRSKRTPMKRKSPTAEAAPILKWVGGKRQLLEAFAPLLPKAFDSYCEPFVGGGALLFHLRPPRAWINDINPELMLVYRVVAERPDDLVALLETYPNDSAFFYEIRNLDRDPEAFSRLSDLERAARTLYLNRTCYNGLYRVNSSGQFNSPFGRYANPNIANGAAIRAAAAYFNGNVVAMTCLPCSDVLWKLASKGDGRGRFVYLDPPYDPVSATASFTGYARGGFREEDQRELRDWCDALDRNGTRFMLSNSATPLVLDLYRHYDVRIVRARRAINSVASGRGAVDEVVVRNYDEG